MSSNNAPMQADAWKMIYLAKRNPQLAPAEFAQAWREHSALGRQCRNVQDKVLGVTQCTSILSMGTSNSLQGIYQNADGVNLLQIRDLQVASDIWNDPETQAIMKPDELRVFDRYVREFTLVAKEDVLVNAPAGKAVLLGFLTNISDVPSLRQASLEFSSWNPGQRLVLNVVLAERPAGYNFDGIVEWWFDDTHSMIERLGASAVQAQLQSSLGAWCHLQSSVFMATEVTHRRP
jgi:hypothetical protein